MKSVFVGALLFAATLRADVVPLSKAVADNRYLKLTGGTLTNLLTANNLTVTGTLTVSGTLVCTLCATSANNLSFFSATTSAQLLALISDETGTGLAVFGTSPTIVTPTIVSFVNAPHNHQNAAGGGTLTDAAIVFATPALGTPISATLTNATGLPISSGVSGLASGIATFLATPTSANFAAALTNETGSGAAVFATSPTLVTPILGTPTSGTLTNATGLPVSTGISGLGTGVATVLATPSSANLAAAITDETGSGVAVFGTSPQFSTAVGINVAATSATYLFIQNTGGSNTNGIDVNVASQGGFTVANFRSAFGDGGGGGLVNVADATGTAFQVDGNRRTIAAAGYVGAINATAKTANYTTTAQDSTLLFNTTGGAFTLTLSSANAVAGQIYIIKITATSTNALTLSPSSGNIDGSATLAMTPTTVKESAVVQFDGTNWWLIGARTGAL